MPTKIASSSASIEGRLTTLGNPTPTAHGLVWGTSPNPTTALTTKNGRRDLPAAHIVSASTWRGLNLGQGIITGAIPPTVWALSMAKEKSFWTTPMTCYTITASDFVVNKDASLSEDIVNLDPERTEQERFCLGKDADRPGTMTLKSPHLFTWGRAMPVPTE